MILIDSNVIIDILTKDPQWYNWSAKQLKELSNRATLVINPIIYTEVSIDFDAIEDLEQVLPHHYFKREEVPYEACFLAGKVFMQYKKSKGLKQGTLPDFFIGAHAAVMNYQILTRDTKRYRTYFPTVSLISP